MSWILERKNPKKISIHEPSEVSFKFMPNTTKS